MAAATSPDAPERGLIDPPGAADGYSREVSFADAAPRADARSPLALSALAKAAEAVPLILLLSVVPRVLGPADYGRVALVLSIVTLGSASMSLGGPVLLSRYVPAAEPARRAAVARAFARRLALWRGLQVGAFALAAVALAALLPGRFPPLVSLLVVVALSLDVAATLCFQIGLGIGRAGPWLFRYAFQNALLVAAVLALAVGVGHRAAVVGVAIASAGAFLLGAASVVGPLANAGADAPLPEGALRFGVLQGIGGVFVHVLHRGGVALVALLAASGRQTGFAALAISCALAATYGVWQAFAIQLPRLSEGVAAEPRAAEAAAERLAWTSLMIVAPVTIVAALVLEPLLPALAGARFVGAEDAFAPALAVIPLAPLSALVNQTTVLRLRPDLRLWATASGAAVFFVVAAATIPFFGAAGATTALLCGTLLTALVSVVLLPEAASRRVLLTSIGSAASVLALTLALGSVTSPAAVLWGIGWVVAAMLGLLALRRLVLVGAALLPGGRANASGAGTPRVTLLLSARNEEAQLNRTFAAIDRLEYPPGQLSIVLVDDGSGDRTAEAIERWVAGRPHATALFLSERQGKPQALNAALRVAPPGDLIAVCDADQEPQPDSLRRVVAAFADETVGAAGAFLRPVNANASMVARYAAVETWVTQLVTSAGRSRLDLNPPMLGGGSVYRRRALEEIGGFPAGLVGEDVGASVVLTRYGWRTRFVRDAVVDNRVVEHRGQYWHQHVRWARSGYGTVRLQRGGSVSVGRRIESWMLSAGYADRLALLAAGCLVVVGDLPVWVPGAYLAVVALEVVVAIALGGAIRRLPLYLAATAALVLLDAAATVAATVAQLSRRPLQWRAPRPGAPDGDAPSR